MSLLLARKKLLGATQETTSGTAASVTAALAGTVVYDAEMVPDDMHSAGKRMPHGHYLGTYDAVKGLQTGTLRYKQELRWQDGFAAMLTGAGYVLDTGVYKPTSSFASRKTWSLAIWEDGRKKMLIGAVASALRISGKVGERVFADWEWKGVWQAVTDAAMPALAPINSAPYIARALTLTFGGAALPAGSEFEINLGLTAEPREDLTATQGVSHFVITEREPTLTIDPEARLVASHDAFGGLLAGTTGAISLVLTADGETLTIAAPRAQRISVGTSARGLKATDPITLALHASSGDDELTFTEST